MSWPQLLQQESNAATALLGIPQISIALNNGASPHRSMTGVRVVAVGARFLDAIGETAAVYGTFHEVGHIYVAGKYGSFPTQHDEERACDLVAGWLLGKRGRSIGVDDSLTSGYGATIFDAYANAPLHQRIAVVLKLDATATHPAGGDRARVVLDGWLDAQVGRPCRV